MSGPDSYVREIDSLSEEIKRLNAHLKNLRNQRKVAQNHLYQYMSRHNLEKYQKHTLKSVAPRKTKPRKSESAKKEDGINFLINAGISNPEDFFAEFKATQKYGNGEEVRPRPKKEPKKKKREDDYDPFLGF